MDDDELQAIRARRLAELQGQKVQVEVAAKLYVKDYSSNCAVYRFIGSSKRITF